MIQECILFAKALRVLWPVFVPLAIMAMLAYFAS